MVSQGKQSRHGITTCYDQLLDTRTVPVHGFYVLGAGAGTGTYLYGTIDTLPIVCVLHFGLREGHAKSSKSKRRWGVTKRLKRTGTTLHVQSNRKCFSTYRTSGNGFLVTLTHRHHTSNKTELAASPVITRASGASTNPNDKEEKC